ncbi:MAG: WD40 repeat domain-containing protein [Planctomycetaceae bacterium]
MPICRAVSGRWMFLAVLATLFAAETRAADVWTPGAADAVLPGVVPRPAQLPGVGRWQVVRVELRCHIAAVALQPEGILVAYPDSKYVRIVNPATMELEQVLVGHADEVKAVAWSPDGKRIASAGADKTIRIWTAAGAPERVLKGHEGQVNALAWSPDSTQVVSGASDATVRVWKSDGTAGPVIAAHPGGVYCVDWSPDGHSLASGGADQLVKIWQTDGTLLATCEGHYGRVTAVAWSPDGKHLASGDYGTDPTSDDEKPNAHGRLWSSDGKSVAILRGHQKPLTSVAWSPDATQIVTGCEDRIIRFFNVDGSESHTIRGVVCEAVRWRSDGEVVVAVGRDTVRYFTPDGRELGQLPPVNPRHYIQAIAWHPQNKWIASAGRENLVRLWKVDGHLGPTIGDAKVGLQLVAWKPDGSVLAAGGVSGAVMLLRDDGTTESQLAGHTGSLSALAWSPDGAWLASASSSRQDPTVRLWSAGGEPGPVMEGDAQSIFSLSWSPDGKQLVSGGNNGNATIWEAETGGLLQTFEGLKTDDVDAIGWGPDGKALAIGRNGPWTLWSTEGKQLSVQQGHVDSVMTLKFSPDGKMIATGGWDHTVRLWSNEGKPLRELRFHTGPAYGVSWSPDSKRLVSCSVDGSVHVWNVETSSTEWIGLYLQDDAMITLSAAGQLIDGDPDAVETGLRYLLERPDGSMEIVRYDEFMRRVAAGAK